MSMLTEEQAYAAMYHFLEKIYERNKMYELGALMGDISLLTDGEPADIAVKHEWKDAIKFALGGGKADLLTFTEPKETTISAQE